MTSVFVTGTDTGVGKTLVSAWLVRSWHADYWKPVQSGTDDGRDADVVRAAAPDAVIHDSVFSLAAPLSPHEAARREGVAIRLEDFCLPATPRSLVVEGAGGVLAPLNDRHFVVDLIVRLGLPALVVARSGLGTINHTLLTVEALRRRDVTIAGIVLNGPAEPANRQAIEHFAKLPVVAELPGLADASAIATHPPLSWCPAHV